MTQPSYSPDLAPLDFWLFPKLKSPLKGKRFQTIDEIQDNMIGYLIVTPKKSFAECFEKWKKCLEICDQNNTPTHASHLMQSFLAKHQITQVTQPSYSPDLASCNFWLFPKLKSPLKRKRFQTISEIQENRMGQLMAIGRTVWGPKVPTLKGTKMSLSYVQCCLYLVSSSVNVSIFNITWLDTFWTDHIYI